MAEKLEVEVEGMLRKMTKGKWTDFVKSLVEQIEIESIEKCKGNKLCKAKIIAHLLAALDRSLKGWGDWMNFDKMDDLTEEEMDELYPRLKKLVIEWLKLDIEVTEKKEAEQFQARKQEVIEKIVKAKEAEAETKKKRGKADPKFYVS